MTRPPYPDLLTNMNYSIVVAHPDDEVLWASSIIQGARKVIICFTQSPLSQKVTDGRNYFKGRSPDNFVFLDLPESRLKERNIYSFLSRKVHLQSSDLARNELLISQHLQHEINDEIIFTHNPWGEYGHPEHIQVHRVVASFCQSRQKRLYVFGYYSSATFFSRRNFLLKNQVGETLHLPTNKDIYCDLRDLYILSECWTWDPKYMPPQDEFFYRFKLGSKPARNAVLPGNYIVGITKYMRCLFFPSEPASTIRNRRLALLLALIENLMYFPSKFVAALKKRLLKKAF